MSAGIRRALPVLLLTTLGCAIMAWVEGVLQPVYPVKSALKLLVFLGLPALYGVLTGDRTLPAVFRRPGKRELLPAALLALGVFVVIWGGYLVLGLERFTAGVTENLAAKEGITAATFPIAALYISFINSMLEEFFFRGFACLHLRDRGPGSLAVGFFCSALAFGLYHVCIMDGWFPPFLFVLFTIGLTLVGLLFNALDLQSGSVWPAWLVHMAANLAINTIGLHLFGWF